jgi:hypothetical protein
MQRERERENSGSSDGNIHLRCLVSETEASSTRQGGERGGVSHLWVGERDEERQSEGVVGGYELGFGSYTGAGVTPVRSVHGGFDHAIGRSGGAMRYGVVDYD